MVAYNKAMRTSLLFTLLIAMFAVVGKAQNSPEIYGLNFQNSQLKLASVNPSTGGTNISPNPAKTLINISLSADITEEQGVISIIDAQGRQLLEVPAQINQIDIRELPSGLYFLQLTTEKGSVTKRFVKE